MASSYGVLQMSIDVGLDKGKTMDIQKSNNALEITIADFSIGSTYITGLLSKPHLENIGCCKVGWFRVYIQFCSGINILRIVFNHTQLN